MCGIAGMIGPLPLLEAEANVTRMVQSLMHRGPDAQDVKSWSVGQQSVVLGHTRLAILDTSDRGRQPMCDSTRRFWIVFNGEIYNFQELRKILDQTGKQFQTGTDTEVILEAYSRWSSGAFQRFRGMFAFGLLDLFNRKMFLARDPLGIKPLYYTFSNGLFQFASEVQALMSSGGVHPRLNKHSIDGFLATGSLSADQTVLTEIKALQPGELLTVDLSGAAVTWTIETFEEAEIEAPSVSDVDRGESVAHLHHLLTQSVKCHLISDVPVGLFLSGGIDSSALLQLMRASGCGNINTFTITFDEPEFGEHRFAERIAAENNAQHSTIVLTETDLLRDLHHALISMDQPTIDGVNTYVVSKAVRQSGIKVALSGLGSDELFAGYPSFSRAEWARLLSNIPRAMRTALAKTGRLASPGAAKAWDLLESDCTPMDSYKISRQLFSRMQIRELTPEAVFHPEESEGFSGDVINEVSRLESKGYMTDMLLRDSDFMSMASSLEVRVPFVDKEIVRFVSRLPGHWKVAPNKPKALLLQALGESLPEYVWKRRKMGFALPFERWLRSALRPEVEATLLDRSMCESIGLSARAVEEVWSRFLRGENRWSKPWALFVLLKWCSRNRVAV